MLIFGLPVAVVATFVAVVLIIFGAYWFVIALPEQREQSALKRRLKSDRPSDVRVVQLLKREESLSSIGLLDLLLSRFSGLSAPLKQNLDTSGLSLTVGAFVLMTLTVFFAVFVAVDLYSHIWWMALIFAAVAAYGPSMVVKFMKTRRLRQFEEQFPEAIELIARAMRAGHAFATGLKMASDEMPQPSGPEFKLLYERQNYGAQLPDALKSFADRIPLLDARFFVTAVLTQREAGGNLSEVLDRLASVMRERFKIRREVRTRSAHGRMTAYILAGLPPTLAVLMFLGNPDQLQIMLTDPLGIRMIVAAIVLQVLGTLIVRKIVDIQY